MDILSDITKVGETIAVGVANASHKSSGVLGPLEQTVSCILKRRFPRDGVLVAVLAIWGNWGREVPIVKTGPRGETEEPVPCEK